MQYFSDTVVILNLVGYMLIKNGKDVKNKE